MKTKLITLLLILPFCFIAQSQTKQEAQYIAKKQIQSFKTGVLLVRLYNKKNVIDALKEKGMEKRAEAVKNKQEKLNNEIMSSFKNFSFCDVYFFYSNNSSFLLSKEYSQVDLFSIEGEKKEYKLTEDNYFVADFGVLKNESSSSSNTENGNKTVESTVKTYKGGNSITNKKCMFLRDNELRQLKRPFPYTVWFHPTPVQQLSYEDVVEKMDNQLKEYYAKNK